MGLYVVCYIECEECRESEALISSCDAAKCENGIVANYDAAVKEALELGWKFVDNIEWRCPDCLSRGFNRFVACYGTGGDDAAPLHGYVVWVTDLTFNPDGSPAWPDSISAHHTEWEANAAVQAYLDAMNDARNLV